MKKKSKTRKRAKPSGSREAVSGLCSTCNRLSTCTYAKERGKKDACVTQCEEFDDYQPRPRQPKTAPEPRSAGRPPVGDPPRSDVRGLCMTCAQVESCTFNRPEGGVWHCQEYM